MLATKIIGRLFIVIVGLLFLAACDDDDKKTTIYEVEIEKTENVRIVVRPIPSKDSKKPRMKVTYPPKVDVEKEERDPDKKTIIKYVPTLFLILLVILLVVRRQDRIRSSHGYLVGPSSLPTYQRG